MIILLLADFWNNAYSPPCRRRSSHRTCSTSACHRRFRQGPGKPALTAHRCLFLTKTKTRTQANTKTNTNIKTELRARDNSLKCAAAHRCVFLTKTKTNVLLKSLQLLMEGANYLNDATDFFANLSLAMSSTNIGGIMIALCIIEWILWRAIFVRY